MTSNPQDFTGWMHLLPIAESGRIGLTGEQKPSITESLHNFGAEARQWDLADGSRYDGVIVDAPSAEFVIQDIAKSVNQGGFIWIWNFGRNHRSFLNESGFETQVLAALPSQERPRFVYDPRSGRKAVRGSIAVHSTSSIKTSFAKSLYAILANPLSKFRLGPPTILLATRIADKASSRRPVKSTWDQMCDLDSRVVHPTVISASPGKGQKGVLAGADNDGIFHMFCKVADTESHGHHLNNEAAILSEHIAAFEESNLRTPGVVAIKTDQGFTKLFIGPVPGSKLSYNKSLPESLARSMGTLFARSTDQKIPGIAQFIDRLIDQNEGDTLIAKACSQATEHLGSQNVPLGLAHRDFVFWNILNTGSGWGVIDWEWARDNHIPFQDIFHFYIHGSVNEKGLEPIDAVSILHSDESRHTLATYARAANVDTSIMSPMFTLYLCDWIGIQNGLGLKHAQQTIAYRRLLDAVVDGKISI